MKNIYLIPTDLATTLQVNRFNKLFMSQYVKQYQDCINQFIYITNEESIDKRNWFYVPNQMMGYEHVSNEWFDNLNSIRAKKIILTNDPKLIADGVQELTEEQLQDIVYKYPLDYVKVMYEPKNFLNVKEGWEYCLHFNSFSAENIINNWLDKNDTKEIKKEVEMEAEKYSKLISEFEILEGVTSNIFDEKDWIRFDRFIERQEKENQEDLDNKDNWEFERSSGYRGYRNKVTGDWIYEKEYLEKFTEKREIAEKETLEKIKFVLSANNEAQAIRFIEQYGEYVKENCRKEFEIEIDKISLSNEDINSWGDGFEYAIKQVYKSLNR